MTGITVSSRIVSRTLVNARKWMQQGRASYHSKPAIRVTGNTIPTRCSFPFRDRNQPFPSRPPQSILNTYHIRLSSSAAVEATVPEHDTTETKKKRTKRKSAFLDDKDPIKLTPRAADRIRELFQGDGATGAVGIRVGVKRRGCNGLSYTLNYVFPDMIPEKDIQMEQHGIKVFIEPMALFNIVGTTMDWEETELSSEFTFQNPNSKGECGCGESFTV